MNNVTGSWLKRKQVPRKMPMYSRSGKMYCVLKESNVVSTDSYSLAAQEMA